MTKPALQTLRTLESDRAKHVLRWILAAPGALLLSVLVMASFPLFLPKGAGGANHVVFPVLAFPFIWATLAVLPVSTRNIHRMALIYAGLLMFCLAMIGLSFVV